MLKMPTVTKRQVIHPPMPAQAKYALRSSGYRLVPDPIAFTKGQAPQDIEWLDTVPCRRGGPEASIYIHGVQTLGFWGKGPALRRELLELGCKTHQTGDEEFTVTFPYTMLKAVGKVVKARTKRVLSAEHKAKLALTRHRF